MSAETHVNGLIRVFVFACGLVVASSVMGKDFYAIATSRNVENNMLVVSVTKTNDRADCEGFMRGTLRGEAMFGGYMRVLKQECTESPPIDMPQMFSKSPKPIEDFVYVVYPLEIWQRADLYTNFPKSTDMMSVCAKLLTFYKLQKRHARCVM